jgi:hypothetical protein
MKNSKSNSVTRPRGRPRTGRISRQLKLSVEVDYQLRKLSFETGKSRSDIVELALLAHFQTMNR